MTALLSALFNSAASATPAPSPSPSPTPGVPTPNYDFDFLATGNSLPAGAVLTRSSIATYTTNTGMLQQVAADTPRFEYRFNPTGAPIPLGLMIEPAATNLLAFTGDLTNGIWGKSGGVTVAANAANGPDGSPSMESITNSTSTFNEVYQPLAVTGAQPYAISSFVKYGSGDQYIVQQLTELGGRYGACSFQILADNFGYAFVNQFTAIYSALEPYANSIVRITTVVTPTASQASNVGFYLQSINPGATFQASAGSVSYLTDVQCELAWGGNDATSYIPNTGAGTATRAADIVRLTMTSGTYDILVEDFNGGEFRTAVNVTTTYTLLPRPGHRHVRRVRAWNTASNALTAAQRTALTPTDTTPPHNAPTLAPPAGSPSPTPTPTPTPVPAPGGHDKTALGWSLTFLDDFDGVIDTDGQRYFDRTKWGPGSAVVSFGQDSWGDGSRYFTGNVEQQLYCDKDFNAGGRVPASRVINPFSFANSVMTITVNTIPADIQAAYFIGGYRIFSSGMLNTSLKFAQKYGLFEMRARTFGGAGCWPAFWFLKQATSAPAMEWPPELDAVEQFPRLRPTQSHYGIIQGAGDWVTLPNGARVDDGFHLYGVQWGAVNTTWYIDGIQTAQTPSQSIMNAPMYILINVAVGGEWYRGEAFAKGDPTGGGPGDYMTLANYALNTPGAVPYSGMQVDYVRAYTRTDGGTSY